MLGLSGRFMDGIKLFKLDGSQLCSQTDPEIFFPEVNTPPSIVKLAKSICNDCHFQAPCLEYALKTSPIGIWGGTSDRERQEIRRRRKQKAAR